MEIKARNWDDIERFYESLIKHGWDQVPMLQLIQHIRETGLDKRLYAFTSMWFLKISIYDPIDNQREILKIEFDRHKGIWVFNYYARGMYYNNRPPEFTRLYDRDKGIEKFDQFIKWIKW